MQHDLNKKSSGLALVPFVIFVAIYLGAGLILQAQGVEMAFYQFPSVTAMFIALLAAFAITKGPLDQRFAIFARGAANIDVLTMLMIYLLAGAFSGVAGAMGGRDATVNLGLSLVPVQFLAAGVFIISAFMGTATGTSMGTISAIVPIAVGVADKGGLSIPMMVGACVGGAMFGDNLSMISDTTISAAQGCGSEMKDKFRMNFFMALPAAIVAIVIYGILGSSGAGAVEAGSYNVIQVLPYIVVLVTALLGVNVAVVLFVGILMTGVIGIAMGTVGFFEWVQAIGGGMSDMFSISIVAALISGIIGLVRYYGGVEWMVNAITSRIKNRRGAEYGIGLLSGVLSAALVNNTIGIIVTCPLAREIGGKYGIAPKRLASLVDIFACAFLSLMPHDGGILIVTELAGCTPLEVLPYSFYMFALIIFTCVTIQMGLLRTPEEKAAAEKNPALR